jgi:hypothetical protein
VLRRQGQRQQQSGQELAGHVAAHLNGLVQLQALVALQVQRRKAVLTGVVDLATQLAQGVHQVADGPLVHARHAMQLGVCAHQR